MPAELFKISEGLLSQNMSVHVKCKTRRETSSIPCQPAMSCLPFKKTSPPLYKKLSFCLGTAVGRYFFHQNLYFISNQHI